MYVGNVKTPTMLMTGVNDLRTPMPQTEEFYSALKLRKVPTAMLRFNDEWHGTTSKPSNFMRTQLYLRYWFEKYKRRRRTARRRRAKRDDRDVYDAPSTAEPRSHESKDRLIGRDFRPAGTGLQAQQSELRAA